MVFDYIMADCAFVVALEVSYHNNCDYLTLDDRMMKKGSFGISPITLTDNCTLCDFNP